MAELFKVGDRIVALGETMEVTTVAGDIGTVEEVYGTVDEIFVRWDRAVNLVGCDDGEDDHFWYARFTEVRLATDAEINANPIDLTTKIVSWFKHIWEKIIG